MRRKAFAALLLLLGASGCALLFDFGDFDVASVSPDASPGDAEGIRSVEATSPLVLIRGRTTDLDVTVVRGTGFGEEITIALEAPIPDVDAPPVTIAAADSKVALKLHAKGTGAFVIAPQPMRVIARSRTSSLSSRDLEYVIRGAPGTLDTTFGDGGVLLGPTPDAGQDEATSITIEGSSGRILVGAVHVAASTGTRLDGVVACVTPTGEFDPTFAANGYSLTSFANTNGIFAIALQADKKIVAAGYNATKVDSRQAGSELQVTRFLASGLVDTTFGPSGTGQITKTIANSGFDVRKVAIDPTSGRILVASTRYTPPPPPLVTAVGTFRVDAFLPSGAPDPSFGNGGVVEESPNNVHAIALALALVDNAVFVGGLVHQMSGGSGMARLVPGLVRLNNAGVLDPTFGRRSIEKMDPANKTVAIAPAANGSLFVAAQANLQGADISLGLTRIDRGTAAPDESFGTNGVVIFPFNIAATSYENFQLELAAQADDKALVAVYARDRIPLGRLYRFSPSGALDPQFGLNGAADIDKLPPRAIALQRDGRIVIAGVHAQKRAFIARLWD